MDYAASGKPPGTPSASRGLPSTRTRNSERNDRLEIPNALFIAGEVISSKNSRVNLRLKNTNFTPSVLSAAAKKYVNASKWDWSAKAPLFRNLARKLNETLPVVVQMVFVRETRRSFDYHNMVQLPADLMQQFGWIGDDDHQSLIILPPPKTYYNAHNPGLYIRVLSEQEKRAFFISSNIWEKN